MGDPWAGVGGSEGPALKRGAHLPPYTPGASPVPAPGPALSRGRRWLASRASRRPASRRRSPADLPPGSRRGVRARRAASALPGGGAPSGRGVTAGSSGRCSPPRPGPRQLGPGAAGVQTAPSSRVWSGASASDAQREPAVAAHRVASGGGSRARPLHSGGGREDAASGGRSSREETRWVHLHCFACANDSAYLHGFLVCQEPKIR
ncbi:translation initiation factor IF-2-like [Moschus berezovskii]|uniref:translation initiation factor IF-2-like n=1 Tax=Moschus berezovskii TaxID=68408 RepID=UPI0024447DBA|nr:translation initiation factor IF-2-like [Moschus berezovskii]